LKERIAFLLFFLSYPPSTNLLGRPELKIKKITAQVREQA